MDDGIFKTGRTVLVGGRRVDIQWMWQIEERAARLEKACRPPKVENGKEGQAKQIRLPGI